MVHVCDTGTSRSVSLKAILFDRLAADFTDAVRARLNLEKSLIDLAEFLFEALSDCLIGFKFLYLVGDVIWISLIAFINECSHRFPCSPLFLLVGDSRKLLFEAPFLFFELFLDDFCVYCHTLSILQFPAKQHVVHKTKNVLVSGEDDGV